jgi:hypothetical protein
MTTCRWCRGEVARGFPCPCARAQQELARIRAESDVDVRRTLPTTKELAR